MYTKNFFDKPEIKENKTEISSNPLWKSIQENSFAKSIADSKITKGVIIGFSVVVVLGVAGYLFKLLNFTTSSFKTLKNTINQ